MRKLIFLLVVLFLVGCDKEVPQEEEWFEEDWTEWEEPVSEFEDIGVDSLYADWYAIPNPYTLMQKGEVYHWEDWHIEKLNELNASFPDIESSTIQSGYVLAKELVPKDQEYMWMVVSNNPTEDAQLYLMNLIEHFGYKAIVTPEQYISSSGKVYSITRETPDGILLVRANDLSFVNSSPSIDIGGQITTLTGASKYYVLSVTLEGDIDSSSGNKTLGGEILDLSPTLEIVMDNYIFNYFDKVIFPVGIEQDGQAFICSVGFLGEHEYDKVRITYYGQDKVVLGVEESILHPFVNETYKLSVWTVDLNAVPVYVSILLYT